MKFGASINNLDPYRCYNTFVDLSYEKQFLRENKFDV